MCVMLSAEAQNTDAHIHGHVIDKATGEHLPYIFVMLKGTTIGVATENTGHYIIRKDRSYEVNFTLEEDFVQIDGVIVSSTRSETTRRMSPTLPRTFFLGIKLSY